MTKKVLVTGVSGFLGHHCATELIKSGYFVKGTVRDLRRKNEVLNGIKKEVDPNEKIEFIELDLLKDDGWEDAVKGCEYILHVASPSSVDEPIFGTANIFNSKSNPINSQISFIFFLGNNNISSNFTCKTLGWGSILFPYSTADCQNLDEVIGW